LACRLHASSCGVSDRGEESMRLYIQKLLHAFPDDPWRGHCYGRDVIVPRFINIWLTMYIDAARYQNCAKMREYAQEALNLVPLLGMKWRRFAYSLGLPLLRCPTLGMAMIAARNITRHVLH
jgi:hypothetical protein